MSTAPAPTPAPIPWAMTVEARQTATISLRLILFSASLTALQNFNPVQRFFCRPLLLTPCTVPCKIVLASLMILIHAQTTLTCVSLLRLRHHHRAQWLA